MTDHPIGSIEHHKEIEKRISDLEDVVHSIMDILPQDLWKCFTVEEQHKIAEFYDRTRR